MSGRRLWLTVGGAFAVVLLAYGALIAVELLTTTTRTEQLSFGVERGIKRLRIDSAGGSVQLVGTDGDAVTGTVRVRGGLRRPTHRETVEGDTLVLHSTCPSLLTVTCDVTYHLDIPRGLAVEVDASGGGFRGTDLNGRVSVDSSGGGITLDRPGGEAQLHSSGGGITVNGGRGDVVADSSGGGIELDGSEAGTVDLSSSGGGISATFAVAPRSVRAESSGGGVTVAVPRGEEAYRVDASASGGDQRVEVRTDPDAERAILLRSSGGGVTVRYAD